MKIVLALTLGLMMSPVFAQDMSYEMCTQEAGSNVEMYECGEVELKKLEGQISATNDELKAAFLPNQPQFWAMAQEGQKAFLKERDEYCEREAMMAEGGTLGGQIMLVCLVEKTAERVKELDEFAKAFR